ncbi:hydrogenase-1 expression HyaE [Novosphingobium profundi]|uniref:hydrogenase-1 expression HyaE n=1 Tax=Novosphingobium profundi TaxID=1774954 RepID=UPI001CFDC9F8|nr:hydrogenase-1 expression HyaE [Novosphingobium profundi]
MTPVLDFSPLLEGICQRHGYPIVGEADLDAALEGAALALLFFCGDHRRLAESNDVAVVLPELDKALAGHARVLVCAREDERALQRRFRFTAFPTLVFLREGRYLGAIEGIRDWSDYLVEIPEILGREPSDPPAYKLPAGCGESR